MAEPTPVPSCVKCRYSRPGASTTHRDHVADAEPLDDEGLAPGGWAKSPT